MTAKIWLPVTLSVALLGWIGMATPDAAQAQSSLLISQAEGTVKAVQNAAPQTVQPQTQGGVTFVSGGVGDDGKAAMRAIESGYNLRLLFAVQGSGEYLAGVHVKLLELNGNTLVDTVAEGPSFSANVRAGKYEIVAESQGKTLTRSVEVPQTGAISQTLYWQNAG